MRLTLVLADPEGTITVTADGRDRRAAELKVWKLLGLAPGTPMSEVYSAFPETVLGWMAWNAAVREDLLDVPWKDLEPRLVEVQTAGEDDMEDGGLGDPT